MLVKTIITKIIIIFSISILCNNFLYSKTTENKEIALEIINNNKTLVLKDNKPYKQKVKLSINGNTLSLTFTNGKTLLPKEFSNYKILSIKEANGNFINTKIYFLTTIFNNNYAFNVSVKTIIFSLVIIIAILIVLYFIFKAICKIVIPIAIIIIVAVIIFRESEFIQKNIYPLAQEYKDKISHTIKNLF